VPPGVRQRLLDDAVRRQVDPGRQRNHLPLQDQPNVRTRVAGGVDELVQTVESRLRHALGFTVDVLAQHAEQAARLGQRLAGGLSDRLEAAARVGRELRGGEPRGLGLNRDYRQVVGDDVVQLTRDPRTLLHRRLTPDALCHRLLCGVELGHDLGALARRLADEHRGDDQHQRGAARQADAAAVHWSRGMDDEGDEQRRGDEEPAPNDEVPDGVEQDPEARQRERRVGVGEDGEGDEARPCRGQKRKPLCGQQRHDREHVPEDGGCAVPLSAVERELARSVRSVEARLDGSSHSEEQCEREAAVTAREQPPRLREQAFAVPGELHDAIVVGRTRARLPPRRDLPAHPAG
jgi:hypothetical protein